MSSPNKPEIERRAKQRYRATIPLHLHHDETPTQVPTRDICLHGLSCRLPSPLNLFTKYRFRLMVPVEEGRVEEVDGEGIVVRVEEEEVDGRILFETALYFQQLDDGHRRILETFLENSDPID